MKKYELHPREYTVIGISDVFQKFCSDDFKSQGLFGAALKELIFVVKDGIFYHAQMDGDRKRVSSTMLRRFESKKVDFEKIYKNFVKKIAEYEKFVRKPSSSFSLYTLEELYDYYSYLIEVAYGAFDGADFIDLLKEKNRKPFFKWAEKARKRAENIYKYGETVFVPRYLKWMEKNLKGYKANQLKYVFYKEYLEFVEKDKKLPSVRELKERKKWMYVRYYYPDKYQVKTGKAAAKEIRRLKLFEKEKIDTSKLKGQVAFRGKAKGKARLIFTTKDMSKFKKGDILISPMTVPNYLPIMKQASAIVTDEGGTLCHAAIVARELKKPCIIATKHATSVFKDGDMVEVDADKGMVKKVKK